MTATAANPTTLDIYRQALAIDTSANEPETNMAQERLMEQVFVALAAEAFGTNPADLRYVNSEPTGEREPSRYGSGDEAVWRTYVSDQPTPLYLRAVEFGDLRIVNHSNRITDLRFSVTALTDELAEGTDARQDRFGFEANVEAPTRKFGKDEDVTVRWGGTGTRTIEAAETKVRVYGLAIRLAYVVEALYREVTK